MKFDIEGLGYELQVVKVENGNDIGQDKWGSRETENSGFKYVSLNVIVGFRGIGLWIIV